MKLYKKIPLIAAIAIFSLTVAQTARGQEEKARFSMEVIVDGGGSPPSYFVFDAEDGSEISGKVLVKNTGTAVGTSRLYAVDTTTGQTGGTTYLMPEDPLQRAGAWIALESDMITLEPGMGEIVAFKVIVPDDARAGHHVGGLVLESLGKAITHNNDVENNTAAFVVDVQTRIAMAVQVNVAGTAVSQLDVVGLRLGGHNNQQILYLQLQNSGNQMLKPTGTLKVYDSTGKTVQHLRFNVDTFLPESEIEYPIYVQEQALGTGDYLGDLRLRYQTGETVFAHQFNFTVSDEINVQIFNAREPLEAPNFITNNSNNFILPIISTPWGIGSLILAIAAVLSLLSWQGLRHYRRKQIA